MDACEGCMYGGMGAMNGVLHAGHVQPCSMSRRDPGWPCHTYNQAVRMSGQVDQHAVMVRPWTRICSNWEISQDMGCDQ